MQALESIHDGLEIDCKLWNQFVIAYRNRLQALESIRDCLEIDCRLCNQFVIA